MFNYRLEEGRRAAIVCIIKVMIIARKKLRFKTMENVHMTDEKVSESRRFFDTRF